MRVGHCPLCALVQLLAHSPQISKHMFAVRHEQLGSVTGRTGTLVGRQLSQAYIYFMANCH